MSGETKNPAVKVDLYGPVKGSTIGVGSMNQTNVQGDYVGGDNIKGHNVLKIGASKGNISVNEAESRASSKEDRLNFVDKILSNYDKSDIEDCKKILKKEKIVDQSDLLEFSEEELVELGIPRLFVRRLRSKAKSKPQSDTNTDEEDHKIEEKNSKKVMSEPNVVHCDRDYIGGDRMEGNTLFKIGHSKGNIAVRNEK